MATSTAGGGNAIASNVGDYQGLQLRQQFASKRYDDAAASLQRARELGGDDGFYVLQAMIVACHAEAASADATDWGRIASLYATLAARVLREEHRIYQQAVYWFCSGHLNLGADGKVSLNRLKQPGATLITPGLE